MAAVAIVTDSTAALPAGFAEQRAVTVVPVQVVIDGVAGLEGTDVSPASVAAALRARVAVSTSRPTPAEFARAYDAAAAAGADAIVSVHLSGALSGTTDSARLAAADARVPVVVVDSRSTAMGLGFAVMAAAEAAATGADTAAVVACAEKTAAGTSVLFCVDSLEYLRRGGRIGAAAALIGTALSVKPILRITDGRIAMAEKVRTTSKAMARLGDLAVVAAGPGPVDGAVHHLAESDRASAMADRLRAEIVGLQDLHVTNVGATVAAHTGPGVLGIVISAR
jgi:DegV family protein with EDD domain